MFLFDKKTSINLIDRNIFLVLSRLQKLQEEGKRKSRKKVPCN